MKNAPQIEIELIRDIHPVREYSKAGVMNHLAFRVENLQEAIDFINERSSLEIIPKVRPTADGGQMILFEGLNGEMLQLIEKGLKRS